MIKIPGDPHGKPGFFYVRRFEINISIYRGQPRFDSIITGETHERSVTAYGREVPDTPVKITVAELAETTVMHKKMSAPEIRRDNLQTVKVGNPSIRPRGGQKHICKCS